MLLPPYSPAFVLASAALAVAPGPDILYVLAKGISQGRRAAVVAASGFCSGLVIHTTASVFGISALLVASASAFTALKLLGAGYLAYLGLRAIFSHGMISLPSETEPLTEKRIFAQAFLMNILNPKVALFFLAFLPQFATADRGQLPLELFLLGLGFGTISFGVFLCVAIFSAAIGTFVRTRPALSRFLDYVAGATFLLLGARLALSGRELAQ